MIPERFFLLYVSILVRNYHYGYVRGVNMRSAVL
jgi:hypothetical protein